MVSLDLTVLCRPQFARIGRNPAVSGRKYVIPSPVQDASQPHDGRALLDGDLVVLAGAHRQRARTRGAAPSRRAAGPRARAGAAKWAARPPGARANGGIVIRPAKTTCSLAAARSTNASTSASGTPYLLSSPRRSPRAARAPAARRGARSARSDRVALDRVDQPHARQHVLGLAALEVADEVPGEARRPSAPAWRSGPGPCSRRPARRRPSASAPIISSRHVLGRGEQLDARRVAPGAGRTPPRSRARASAGARARAPASTCSRSRAKRARPAGRSRRRRGGGRRTAPGCSSMQHAAARSEPSARAASHAVSMSSRPVERVGPWPRAKGLAHLGADLVAARPDRRARPRP